MGPVISVTGTFLSVTIGTLISAPAAIVLGVAIIVATVVVVGYYIYMELNKEKPLLDSRAGVLEIPYHVSIQLDSIHLCSGSLINEKYVLTTASCVYKYVDELEIKSRIKVFVGANARSIPDYGSFVGLDRIKIPPSYSRNRRSHDIAVVRLKEKIEESQGVRVIALPSKGITMKSGLELLVSGYNLKSSHLSTTPFELHRINMKVTDDKSCRNEFGSFYDINNKFCAHPSPQYPHCKGDVGGPATVNKEYIIGIYLEPNMSGCEKNFREFLLFLPPYLDFIKSAMA